MCMIDGADGFCTVLHARNYKARKDHVCSECYRAIERGETYLAERTVFDGSAYSYKTCRHCQVVRRWLLAECGGWCYGGILEDISEHVTEGWYGIGVEMLAHGMRRKWRNRRGELWRVPGVPKTTHDRQAA